MPRILLYTGNGKIHLHKNTQCIRLSDNFCNIVATTKDTLIKSTFPNLQANYTKTRIILKYNSHHLPKWNLIQNYQHCCRYWVSCQHYPILFLNSLDLPGIAPHNLRLKLTSSIILFRNLNTEKLCNGTRSITKRKITVTVLEATILNGNLQGLHLTTNPNDPFGLTHSIQTFTISNSLDICNDYIDKSQA